jgi:hypothetical protein
VLLPKLPEERMTIRAAAPGQPWDGRSDMVILRLASQNRMVTKDYHEGLYNWGKGKLAKREIRPWERTLTA